MTLRIAPSYDHDSWPSALMRATPCSSSFFSTTSLLRRYRAPSRPTRIHKRSGSRSPVNPATSPCSSILTRMGLRLAVGWGLTSIQGIMSRRKQCPAGGTSESSSLSVASSSSSSPLERSASTCIQPGWPSSVHVNANVRSFLRTVGGRLFGKTVVAHGAGARTTLWRLAGGSDDSGTWPDCSGRSRSRSLACSREWRQEAVSNSARMAARSPTCVVWKAAFSFRLFHISGWRSGFVCSLGVPAVEPWSSTRCSPSMAVVIGTHSFPLHLIRVVLWYPLPVLSPYAARSEFRLKTGVPFASAFPTDLKASFCGA
mmetsp:Transcript_27799/g.60805  ORF Transcript_27799/g.60805 Transcript_27799/m.60805 type:complete len:314 (-) Transcript_27799:187-1128(-)